MSYLSEVLADAPISYWRLGESVGPTAADTGSGANPGTYTGGFTLSQVGALRGDANTAVALNGTTGYVTVPDKANLRFAGAFTLEAWIYPTDLANTRAIITKEAIGRRYYEWRLDGALGAFPGQQRIIMGDAGGLSILSQSPVTVNAWNHVAMVWDGAAVTFYLNGTPNGGGAGTPGTRTGTDAFEIGRRGGSADLQFAGSMDEVAVYNSALSAARILAHFVAGSPPPSQLGQVLEKPPLELCYTVETPDGYRNRWAEDAPDAQDVPSNVSFGDAMPGGFDTFGATLPRRPEDDYPDLVRFSTIRALGVGSMVAGEYRLTGSPRVSGDQMAISPEAEGWQAHLNDDQSVVFLGVDRDLSHWTDMSAQRRVGMYPNLRPYQGGEWSANSQDAGATEPSILQQFTHLNATAAFPWPIIETWYWAGGAVIGELRYDKTAVFGQPGGGVAWNTTAGLSTDDVATAIVAGTDHDDTTVTNQSVSTALLTMKYAWLQTIYAATIAATDGSWGSLWKNLRVFGAGVTRRGTSPADGVYASDIIQLALAKYAQKIDYTTGVGGSIDATSLVLPQVALLEPTTAAQVIQTVDRPHLWDWAVWEGPNGPRFHYHPRGNYGRKWRARVAPAQLQEHGPSVERVYNGVLVRYQDVDGTQKTVGPPGSTANATTSTLATSDDTNPATAAGLRRWALLDMGIVSTATVATEVGRRFLEEAALLDKSGSATLTGWVDSDRGIPFPYHAVRSGDQIAFVDANDTSYRRIVRTGKNPSQRSVSIDLDAPPSSMDALLERLGVALIPLNLST